MEKIEIEMLDSGAFTVTVGDKVADELNYDEMLGLITQLTIPPEDKRRSLGYLQTPEQRKAWEEYMARR